MVSKASSGKPAAAPPKKKTTSSGGPKKKLTAYNRFMKTEMARLKEESPSLGHKEIFKQATSNWKDSPSNPKNK